MKHILTLFLIIYITIGSLFSQTAPDKYWIQFTDKQNSAFSIQHPEDFLSQRAIDRRIAQNIPIIENDLPVNKHYIDSLKNLGLGVLNVSKWMNAVTIYSTDTALLDTILNLSFVKDFQKSQSIKIDKKYDIKFAEKIEAIVDSTPTYFDYGYSSNQVKMLGAQILHNQGFRGEGMHIAILDAGFYHVNSIAAFDSLWANNQILGTRDFVDGGPVSFNGHTHGMQVLSTMAANIPGQFVGIAPKAKYWLLRSEKTGSENLVEEDNWISAAEYADSAGADIINTSLGYSTFDISENNHSYEDMDGNTTRIARGADIAASKGMLVVVSAGNSGNASWFYITTPADADSALAVGAVDANMNYASFSSKGPSSDGDVKPNVAAKGSGTIVLTSGGSIAAGSGTSFASPLIAGASACLWQANPELSNMQLFEVIQQAGHQYANPDSLLGYGVPNFAIANLALQNITYQDFENENLVSVYPNPFLNNLIIEYYSLDSQQVSIEVFDFSGRTVFSKLIPVKMTSYNKICVSDLSKLETGIYILNINTKGINYSKKIIKN